MTALFVGMAWAKAAGLFFLTFFSEDAATLSGATLTATGLLATPLGFGACFLGIWLGDLGLYALARRFGRPMLDRKWVRRRVNAEKLARSESWLKKKGVLVLLVVRFVPGLRLPTYLISGTLAIPFFSFAAVTGLIAMVWVALVFALTRSIGVRAVSWARYDLALVTLGLGLVVLAWLARRYRGKFQAALQATWQTPSLQRWLQWEFWPAWLFYFPVGLNYIWLGLRHRGFNLPTIANPGMYTGGFAGESKCITLAELFDTSPDFTARSAPVTARTPAQRMAQFESLCAEMALNLPVVLKPDIAQRGSGFKLVRAAQEARAYLEQVSSDVIVQEYLAGPAEAGIFYYRFPNESRGRIFAITEKIFPVVTGDGQRTVEQLIRADKRAAIVAKTYLRRHDAIRHTVLAAGERLKLVEAGNHCQGCIFRDGMHLWSQALEDRIDAISRKLPGFFIGRYDVRYDREADLKAGTGFKILELNGAASEATSIYDNRNSLWRAYATLFKQWSLVFAIGAANRGLGHRPATIWLLWREWQKYKLRAACYPQAD